jgi:hypothetical protein
VKFKRRGKNLHPLAFASQLIAGFHPALLDKRKFSNSEQLSPPRKPFGDRAIRFQRRERDLAESLFTMDEHTFVIAEFAEFVGFDFVLLGFGVIHAALSGAGTPRAFHHLLFAKKIGGLDGIGFVGGAKNHPIAKI